jgi:hypothetical protein
MTLAPWLLPSKSCLTPSQTGDNMSILENIRNWFLQPLLEQGTRERIEQAEKLRNYRTGNHKKFLKNRPGQSNDNLTINFTGLVVDRSVTMLFGKGVEFDLPGEDDTPESQYIDAVMDANKQQILFHKLAILGSEQGTCYLKIIPDSLPYTLRTEAVTDEDGNVTQEATATDLLLPRLVVQDPAWVEVITRPRDKEDVTGYKIEFAALGMDGKPVAYKQEIMRDDGIEIDENGNQEITREVSWTITDYEWGPLDTRWRITSQETWPYDFPPMLHWQNLPDPTSVYGKPDITDDVIELQDHVNFVASNLRKIIRLYAHPPRWGKGLGNADKIALGPDELISFQGKDAELHQLEQLSDLTASSNFLTMLRGALFAITQTTDLEGFDKLSQVTNFGLRVLFNDSLAKLAVKRSLYGDALLELVRRLLILADFPNTDAGEIQWPEPLPVNETEQVQAVQADLNMGLVSRQTAASKRGYSWEDEKSRIETEKQENSENESNIGAMILRSFNGGGGQQQQ